jgi:hypothetical protein
VTLQYHIQKLWNWGFHGVQNVSCSLLGCNVMPSCMYVVIFVVRRYFRSKVSLPSSGYMHELLTW